MYVIIHVIYLIKSKVNLGKSYIQIDLIIFVIYLLAFSICSTLRVLNLRKGSVTVDIYIQEPNRSVRINKSLPHWKLNYSKKQYHVHICMHTEN